MPPEQRRHRALPEVPRDRQAAARPDHRAFSAQGHPRYDSLWDAAEKLMKRPSITQLDIMNFQRMLEAMYEIGKAHGREEVSE